MLLMSAAQQSAGTTSARIISMKNTHARKKPAAGGVGYNDLVESLAAAEALSDEREERLRLARVKYKAAKLMYRAARKSAKRARKECKQLKKAMRARKRISTAKLGTPASVRRALPRARDADLLNVSGKRTHHASARRTNVAKEAANRARVT